jgi:hypothetical protein
MGKANKFEDFKNLETLFSQDELPKEEVKSE